MNVSVLSYEEYNESKENFIVCSLTNYNIILIFFPINGLLIIDLH